jgi:hypothetical protein
MPKEISQNNDINADEMRPEYDFSTLKGGVQGKYYQAYRAGHTVTIHKADGTVDVQYFRLEDGAVMLEPDVRQYFPDSEAVNKALRCLIPLVAEHVHLPVKA